MSTHQEAQPAPSQTVSLHFPENLPVSSRREEIMQAMRAHQVVIVCGETGSGKTTQLPKIALALGRGAMHAAPGQRPRLIGHTQPRRIAASSVAKRIAQELDTPLGEVVGYKVRFADRLQKGASVKLMTDGILLAETQSDPLLKAYDTLIIDEAHERSLNIDFLLGYLRQILPRRPDLRIVVTSATIDAERFAQHFASAQGPAPVIMVSGRLYPVEVRYRPFEEGRDTHLYTAIADAVDELWRNPQAGGDILVFLPGEREIREAADHLRAHFGAEAARRQVEVLPLFARLSQAEQDRVFEPHGGRRIVLATNVAETSLTVPGIHYVIDSGTARVKRYSYRSKVEQLQVEPISQAAANQRAGRCGRVAHGVCIRLYDEKDFAARPRFTDPEILRSSLAGVILRMKSLHLGDIDAFPFLEAPRPKAISDGYQLLAELGAVDDALALTPVGQALARLPLDPRIGRILLEAQQRGALQEALVIASALSVQDVRDRPLDAQAQADQQQARFEDDRSEFSSYLKLWQWLHEVRGGNPSLPSARQQEAAARRPTSHAALPVGQRSVDAAASATELAAAPHPAAAPATHRLSNRQYESVLRQHFINVRRVREWRDIHSQLLTVAGEQKWTLNATPASYVQIHQSMLAGLLGNVGCRIEEDGKHAHGEYLGARGIKFFRHPGAHLRKKPGRWIVCAELVETTRLFGRGMASIEPQWIEEVGAHLMRRQLLDPHWEKKAARVVALERATLYGIVVYNNRKVDYDKVDPVAAREIFIRQALVGDDWDSPLPFVAANRKMIRQVEEMEHKSRRQDLLVDDELIYAFYEAQIPEHVTNAHQLEKWYRAASRGQPGLLRISREELMRHEAAGITTDLFPRTIRLGGVDCRASYLHKPGDSRDGVTADIPLFALNQVDEERCEWLVPGMLKDKIQALLKSLPQRPRSRFVPLPESAQRLATQLQDEAPGFAHGSLVEALLQAVRAHSGLDVKRTDFKLDMLPPHLFMNLRVTDEHGRQLGMGRNLGALKAELGSQARGAFQALAVLRTRPDAGAEGAEAPESPAAIPSSRGHTPATQTGSSDTGSGGAAAPHAPDALRIDEDQRYTAWDFGELPEIMEIRRGRQTLIGYPALVDQQTAVSLSVFDEPEVAEARHRAGLRRLFALHIRDALKYLEKNLPDFQRMAAAYMPLGTAEELRQQILQVAIDRAFLIEPLPHDADSFRQRLEEGRTRLTLIAQEVARQAGSVLAEFAAASRKIKDTRIQPEAVADCAQQLQRLCGPRFLADTPWAQLHHMPRYLKAIVMRLDKLRADPARDAARMAEHRPLEQRYWRLVAERKGKVDARMQEFRWMLEELRVSFYAQELRTPQPVSVKRLEKTWQQLIH